MADWAGLNHDLLIEIVERLPSMDSYHYFGMVCKSWKAASREGHLKRLTSFEAPCLMLAEKDENNKESRELEREFSSITSGLNKTHIIFLPEVSKQFCLPCKDWLLVTSLDEINAALLHPLTRAQIHLPKLTTFPSYDEFFYGDDIIRINFIKKAVLSANPTTTSDFIVMVIYGSYLQMGFWKSGDTSWTPTDYWDVCQFYDIMYFNGMFYGLDARGNIVSSDIHGPNPTKLVQVFKGLYALPHPVLPRGYLVGLPGDKILVVVRCYEHPTEDTIHTCGFKLFEVNIEQGMSSEVHALGNKALFLGHNSSFYIDCTEYNKCTPNCIYFSEDYEDFYVLVENNGGGKDMGIYHLSDESFQPFFMTVLSKITPATWIGPSFL